MRRFVTLLFALTMALAMIGTANATSLQNSDFEVGFIGWYTDGDMFRIVRASEPDRALFGGKSAPTVAGTWNGAYDYTAFLSQGFDITSAMLDISFEYKFTDLDDDDSFTFAFFLKDTVTKALSNVSIFDLDPTTGFASFEETFDLTGVALTNKKGVIAFFLNEGAGESDVTSTQAILRNPSVGDAAPVPEPTTLLLLGSGLIGLAGLRRKNFFRK